MQMAAPQMTQRLLKALAHPTARLINKRAPVAVDLEAVFQAAKERDVALEVNAQPGRLDLSDINVQHARELGVKLIINSDAHSAEGLRMMRYGVDQARRGWLEKMQVVNTLPWSQFHTWLHR